MNRTYKETISPGETMRLHAAGDNFRVLGGTSGAVDVILYKQGGAKEAECRGVGPGFSIKGRSFVELEIISTDVADQTVKFYVGEGDSGFDQPVSFVEVTGTISSRELKDTGIQHVAPVLVGVAATQLVALNANRRGLRFLNKGTSPVYLGGAGVTVANATMVLNPGDYYDETQVPGAAWYGISSVANQSVALTEVMQ